MNRVALLERLTKIRQLLGDSTVDAETRKQLEDLAADLEEMLSRDSEDFQVSMT